MADPVVLYITVPTREEGIAIGRVLVDENLAACANVIDGLTSIFRWEGTVQEEGEALLIAKTERSLIDAATDLVKLEHSYDCPCVVALPIVGGNSQFIDWIAAETREDS
ncbi:MAG: divalent-cation tolerance protein CutA [Rhodospirillales bacterium]